MSHSFKLSRRLARFRAPVSAIIMVAILGCDNTDSFNPDTAQPDGVEQGAPVEEGAPLDPISQIEEDTPLEEESGLAPVEPLSASISFAGGIPIGTGHQPTSQFNGRYNGALRNISPSYLLKELASIKSRGGRVALALAGHPKYYGEGDGFSLSQWKNRVNRFRGIDFSSYIRDGTIVGHYLLDEPNDPSNWGGRPVPPSMVEEMARYSKQLWPGMVTVVRAEPGYLANDHRYLDAAWAQYVTRKGSAEDYIRRNVADAQRKGLALVIGLNILKGGRNGSKMTPSQVRAWGSELLSYSYPCAFISWKYDDAYLSSSGIRDAMSYLRNKAENRSSKSCRSS